jgi:histidinol-phosphate aminotransferase
MVDSRLSPRPEVLATPFDQHGALDYRELEHAGLAPERVLDFSVNSNPYGPSPAVREALAGVPLDRYPDRESLALRRALSAFWQIPMEQILAANGTAELIWLVALAFVRSGDTVCVVGPTFGEYARAASLMGAQVKTWTAAAEAGFAIDTTQVDRVLAGARPRLVFLCNPNNPTGALAPPEAIQTWTTAHPDTLFVVDEAYIQFVDGLSSAANLRAENVLVLRSMTKDYALAGLRLGYALGSGAVVDALARVRPPWSVNALAQAAGVAALQDKDHLCQSMHKLRQAKRTLVNRLRALGLPPVPSATRYFLVRVGDGGAFRLSLVAKQILVRDCASFGLPEYVRIATRTPAENDVLLAAIRAVRC